jgi:hypothetical protein
MTFVTPVDGQPALASHVSQITDTLTGVRTEPLTLKGLLRLENSSGGTRLAVRMVGDTQDRLAVGVDGDLSWGPGDDFSDITLYRYDIGEMRLGATLKPSSHNTYDLGSSAPRWRKLWATDADFANNVVLGTTPSAWGTSYRAVQMGRAGAVFAATGISDVTLSDNAYVDASSTYRAIYGAQAAYLNLNGGELYFYTAPFASAGAALSTTPRLSIWNDGTTTVGGLLQPDSNGTRDLGASGSKWARGYFGTAIDLGPGTVAAAGALRLPNGINGMIAWRNQANTNDVTLTVDTNNNLVPATNVFPNATNTLDLGAIATRWRSAYLGTLLSIAGASATANQITTAITTDSQPRLIVDGNGKMTWGPGGATPQDTTFQRVGAAALRIDNHLGLGSAPPAWNTNYRGVAVAQAGIIQASIAGLGLEIAANSYFNASSNNVSQFAGTGSKIILNGSAITLSTAATVGSGGATQTFTPRLALNEAGTVALTPAASTAAITIGGTAQPKITVASAAPGSPMTNDLWMW